jgi:catechol 2,3-dioxygenase
MIETAWNDNTFLRFSEVVIMAIQTHNSTDTLIDPRTQIGMVSLTIADLERALKFYTGVLGFMELKRTERTALVGSASSVPLIALRVPEKIHERPENAAGLDHFTILVPGRLELAHLLAHIAEISYPLEMVVDHMVNESLYLYDPDGNHLEISRDRSPEELRRQAGRAIPSRQLVNELLKAHQQDQEPWQGAHPQTRIGHLLVRVVDLREAEHFYHDVLGFDVTMRLPGATFVSAGGYHHHIGMATWQSAHGPQASLDVPGLRFFTIQLPDAHALQAVISRLQRANVPFARQDTGSPALILPTMG